MSSSPGNPADDPSADPLAEPLGDPTEDLALGLRPDYETRIEIPSGVALRYVEASSHHDLPSPSVSARRHRLQAATRIGAQPHQIIMQWRSSDVAPTPESNHSPAPKRTVLVQTWGKFAETLAARAPDLLGFSDTGASTFDPQAVHDAEPARSADSDPTPAEHIVDWWKKHPGLRLTKRLSVLDSLVPIILAQRILGKEAKQIHRRLFRHAATEPPGPGGVLVPPSPEALRNIGYETWHQMGLERSRARLIHACAKNAERLESWRDLDTDTLYANLTSISRIGPWTANRLLYALGHADAVWIGDYNLASFVSWNLAREPRANDARMLELLEPYRGHRARVLRLMEFEGAMPPRFGARLSLRNIQHH